MWIKMHALVYVDVDQFLVCNVLFISVYGGRQAMFVIGRDPPSGLSDPSKWSPDFVSFVKA